MEQEGRMEQLKVLFEWSGLAVVNASAATASFD
jgi:hypothetical protein